MLRKVYKTNILEKLETCEFHHVNLWVFLGAKCSKVLNIFKLFQPHIFKAYTR
ncbi:hypothetical protein Fmac_010856 [Flemingia macrophylla]|uniref:Uncharacterized protein n=1 Tax=Flemingia macrophylla TaxID=520843 RepID=A0ABD1MMV8_9FABA